MSYKPISLVSLIGQRNKRLFLPHIQRPFVWEWDQIEKFLDSLLKNYPIQTLLFWRTKEEIRSRKFMDNYNEDPDLSSLYDKNISEHGNEKILVLDGQQRLQSLFIIFNGQYEDKDVYIDLTTGEEEIDNGIHYGIKLSSVDLPLPDYKIKKLISNSKNQNDISDEINDQLEEQIPIADSTKKRKRERLVRRAIAQLVSILREDKYFWVEEIDGVANSEFDYNTVLNIFIRVNSGGTKLGSSDLMFAVMKEAWVEVEENIEIIATKLNSSGKTNFDKTLILKCLMLIIGKGAVLTPQLFMSKKGDDVFAKLERCWEGAEQAFLQLADFIQNELCLYSDKVIRSYNALIPVFEFFYYHSHPSPENREKLKTYYYCSQFFNWYSSQTDQVLNSCHRIIESEDSSEFPLGKLKSYFKALGKSVILDGATLDMRLRYIILNMIYVYVFNQSPFNVGYKGNEPHIDHIYPKSKLINFKTSDINHIGNYRFCGAADNIRKRAEGPDSYFYRLKNAGINIEKHLLVEEYSDDPQKLILPNYIDFREKRHNKILDICKQIINRA
jgi:hypothetical protein